MVQAVILWIESVWGVWEEVGWDGRVGSRANIQTQTTVLCHTYVGNPDWQNPQLEGNPSLPL